MDQIRNQSERRGLKIQEFIQTIKKSFSENIPVSKESIINESCFVQNVSRRTAMEYLEIALSQVPHVEKLSNGQTFFFPLPDSDSISKIKEEIKKEVDECFPK